MTGEEGRLTHNPGDRIGEDAGLTPYVSRPLSRKEIDGNCQSHLRKVGFWVENHGWVKARDLQPGTALVQSDGRIANVASTLRISCTEGVTVYNIEVEGFKSYFVLQQGSDAGAIWVHNKSARYNPAMDLSDYEIARAEFDEVKGEYAEYLGVGPYGQVHHAIELRTLQEYPGVFSIDELNSFENMRGIPAEDVNQIHLSGFRVHWNAVYNGLDEQIAASSLQPGTAAYNLLVRQTIELARDLGDMAAMPYYTEETVESLQEFYARSLGSVQGSGASPLAGVSPALLQTISDSAESLWNDSRQGGVATLFTAQFQVLPAGELGEAQITAVGPTGLATAGTILLSPNADGVGWYVDPTPLDNSEFATQLGPDAFEATGNSPAAGKYDLFTVP